MLSPQFFEKSTTFVSYLVDDDDDNSKYLNGTMRQEQF